jgi:hypothetical protein
MKKMSIKQVYFFCVYFQTNIVTDNNEELLQRKEYTGATFGFDSKLREYILFIRN